MYEPSDSGRSFTIHNPPTAVQRFRLNMITALSACRDVSPPPVSEQNFLLYLYIFYSVLLYLCENFWSIKTVNKKTTAFHSHTIHLLITPDYGFSAARSRPLQFLCSARDINSDVCYDRGAQSKQMRETYQSAKTKLKMDLIVQHTEVR